MMLVNLVMLYGLLGSLALLTALLMKSPKAGIWAIFAAFLIDMAFQALPPAIGFGGLSIYPADALLGLLGLAGVLRWLGRAGGRSPLWVGILGLALAAAVVRGLESYPLQLVFNSSRPWLYSLAVLTYGSSIAWTRERFAWLRQAWSVAAALLLGIGVVWFALNSLGIATYSIYQGTFRFLPAAGALFLAQAALLNLTDPSPSRNRRLLLGLLFLAVLVLQHRTVWLCTLICLLTLPLIDRRRGGRVAFGMSLVGIGALTLSPLLFPSFLLDSLEKSLTTTNTFLWRLDGWEQLLSRERFPDFISVLFGQPMGTGYERVIDQGIVTANPHNNYIQALLDVGMVGSIAYLLILLSSFFNWRRGRQEQDNAVLLLSLAGVVYGGSYFIPYSSALVFSVGLSLLLSRKARTAPRPTFSTQELGI